MIFLRPFGAVFFLSIAVYLTLTSLWTFPLFVRNLPTGFLLSEVVFLCATGESVHRLTGVFIPDAQQRGGKIRVVGAVGKMLRFQRESVSGVPHGEKLRARLIGEAFDLNAAFYAIGHHRRLGKIGMTVDIGMTEDKGMVVSARGFFIIRHIA